MEELNILFEKQFGIKPAKIEKLAGAGSNRIYYRLSAAQSVAIGVVGESPVENKCFVNLAQHFRKKNLPVPQIFAVSDDYQYYLQEDLGNCALFDAIKQGRETGIFSEKERELLCKTIAILPDIQFEGADELDFSLCYPQAEFDKNTVMWDLNYFKYCFLKPSMLTFSELELEKDFEQLAFDLLDDHFEVFLYRDFQSRNVMIKDGQPFFIDFQGGRKGSCYYDVASFVWQAKANFPPEIKGELIDSYLQALSKYVQIDKDKFLKRLHLFVFFRTMQVLGAYGFRGYFERKSHFIESIPFAIKNLKTMLEQQKTNYPYLCQLLEELCDLPQFNLEKKTFDASKLTITIYSFSFKKGIPEDNSGNGGGYVFDCRSINNPGRYEQYKQLTGLDKPVIDFLEKEGEITQFLEEVYKLVETHAATFIARGFSNLMISFGCTGGQHRSVYSAQHTAEYLHKKLGVKVDLHHREQNIHSHFESKTN